VDDILRALIASPHVVYTPFYSVENTLFVNGDLVKASAAASSLDAARLAANFPDAKAWRRQKAELWKGFVALCLFSQKHGLNCDCNYGRHTLPSQDQPDASAPLPDFDETKAKLARQLGFSSSDFDRKLRASTRLVERIYRKNQQDIVFNGKWYRTLLMEEIERAAEGEPYNRHALSNGLMSALRTTLDFNAAWTGYFRGPLQRLLERSAAETSQEAGLAS
jgi:hypothetical protein